MTKDEREDSRQKDEGKNIKVTEGNKENEVPMAKSYVAPTAFRA
jgi:hypothetical protein